MASANHIKNTQHCIYINPIEKHKVHIQYNYSDGYNYN